MQADVNKLRELLAKATPGEWRKSGPMEVFGCVWLKGSPSFVIADVATNHLSTDDQRANAELIAAAITALPELLAIAEASESLRADAMRYRWLRLRDVRFDGSRKMWGIDLDAAIDAVSGEGALIPGATADGVLAVAIINAANAYEATAGEFPAAKDKAVLRQQVKRLRDFAGPIIDADNALRIAARDAALVAGS